MYCPQCGQLQLADTIRFCSRCGFALEGVAMVVSSGGQIPNRYVRPTREAMSPRGKGVRQGAMLMLSTLLVVPTVAIISVNFLPNPEVLIPLAAVLCFVGGLLRILYALIMEDSEPQPVTPDNPGYAPPQLDRSAHHVALPPAPAGSPAGWRQRPNTSELYQPPSVTENTTRLLDKDDPSTR